MKFHCNDTERALGAALRSVRGTRGFEPDDLWAIPRRVRAVFIRLFWSLGGGLLLGSSLGLGRGWDALLNDHWRAFAVGMWFFLEAIFISGDFFRRVMSDPKSVALQMLPVRGSRIVKWALDVQLATSWVMGVRALVISVVLHRQHFESPLGASAALLVLGHAVALWWITLGTSALLCVIHWRSVAKGWMKRLIKGLTLVLALGIASAHWEWPKLLIKPLLPYLDYVSWWLPAWKLGSAEVTPWGALLVILWLSAGLWAWLRLPAALGGVLDRPRETIRFDEVESLDADDELALNENPDGHMAEDGVLPTSSLEPGSDVRRQEAMASLQASAKAVHSLELHGWIERLAWSVLSARQRVVLVTIWDAFPEWSRAWRNACLLITALVALAFASRWFPESRFKEQFPIGVWMGYVGVVCATLLPFANGLGRAFMLWPLGQHPTCQHALLPITIQELNGIATRLTWLRTAVALPVAMLGAVAIQGFIEMHTSSPRPFAESSRVAIIVMAVLFGWAAQRPIFVLYRLQLHSHMGSNWRRFILRLILSSVVVLLALGCVIGTFGAGVGIAAECGAGHLSLGASIGLVIALAMVSALLQRLALGLYLWMYRRLGMDVIARAG